MKTLRPTLRKGLSLLPAAMFFSVAAAQAVGPQIPATPAEPDISFRNEVRHAIDRGLAWLQTNQNSNGWWSSPDHPAVTGLALMSFKGDPAGRYDQHPPAWVERGYAYILDCVHSDGGIYRTNLVTYNTSICMMALLLTKQPAYELTLVNARRCLVGLQNKFESSDTTNNLFNGGVGYGDHYNHTDMGNTLFALEALHYTKQLVRDQRPGEPDLNWNAAIQFLQNCQNLPSHNSQTWVADDPKNLGGFVYYPGNSNAGKVTNAATGRVALRSYGSVSYAGLLSYIYADLKPNDPRVTAAYDWLRRNYTLDENPGMGPQGLYYYYHTMAKALTACGVAEIELTGGEKVPWRKQLGLKLLNLQQKDGSWANDNNRWWEKDPSLVTAYAILSLEMIERGL